MRPGASLLLTLTTSVALLCAGTPSTSAAAAPRTGFWESAPLTERGESASVVVRRPGRRTVVTDISTPAPDCGDVFGIFGDPGTRLPRLAVGRGGRFASARNGPTDGIAAVRGRFHGRRPRLATLTAGWRSGPCRATWDFRLRPVRRVAVRDGSWTGLHAHGGAISFSVVNTGREAHAFTFAWSPEFRCADGSTHRYPSYLGGTELAWIRRDGSFSLRDAEDDALMTMQGSLGADSGTESFRVIERHPDARGTCDTGPVAFTASQTP